MNNKGIESRLKALNAAGFYVNNYVKIVDSNGGERVGFIIEDFTPKEEVSQLNTKNLITEGNFSELGVMSEVVAHSAFMSYDRESDKQELLDELIKLRETGNIESSIHRRFITAHFLRRLFGNDMITPWINGMSWGYAWRIMYNELCMRDSVDDIRKKFFTPNVAYKMALSYINEYEKYVKRNKYYDRDEKMWIIGNMEAEYFESVYSSTFNALENCVKEYEKADDNKKVSIAKKMCTWAMNALTSRFATRAKFNLSTAWKETYKAAGAYYSMRNLMMFHGLRKFDEAGNALSLHDSLAIIDANTDKYNTLGYINGWQFKAELKKLISDNHFTKEQFIENCKKTYNK